MIGVVIPAHDEEERLEACLTSVLRASRHPALGGEPVRVMVVLDDCSDGSARVAWEWGVRILCVEARNVGKTRAVGSEWLLSHGARWLAHTDADTQVHPDWLAVQLALGTDAVCGVVEVDDWSVHATRVRQRYEAAYVDADGHPHIHGANLGVSAAAYARAGGFPALAAHEDVALVRALERTGADIAWSARCRVRTSSRKDARARGGFGDYLCGLAAE